MRLALSSITVLNTTVKTVLAPQHGAGTSFQVSALFKPSALFKVGLLSLSLISLSLSSAVFAADTPSKSKPVESKTVEASPAKTNPLSVHVLNLQTGLPSEKVTVTLEQQDQGGWKKINEGKTNQQGRITALYPVDQKLSSGIYRVTFKTGEWFKAHQQASFFPEVPVIFEVDGSVPHYHIPLLVSPYGYSTYRGN